MSETETLSAINQLLSISSIINTVGIVLSVIALAALIATPIILYKIYRKLK